MTSTAPEQYKREKQFKEFYCGATNIPPNILHKVLRLMGGKWNELDTIPLASVLYQAGVITYDEHYNLSNVYVNPTERVNELIVRILPRKGDDQPNLLLAFHDCLLAANYSRLAREIRQRALVECGVELPILAPEDVCGISSLQTLKDMVEKLKGKHVSNQMAKEFMQILELDGSSGAYNETELKTICDHWVVEKASTCSPEALVEALIITPGMGKFASGIGCPNNPPEVKQWFCSLRENWGDIATYLGYSKNDLEDVVTEMEKNPESQIMKFLALFKMPDCGTRTLPILHKLADFAGVVRKKPLTHQLHREMSGMKVPPRPKAKGGIKNLDPVQFSGVHAVGAHNPWIHPEMQLVQYFIPAVQYARPTAYAFVPKMFVAAGMTGCEGGYMEPDFTEDPECFAACQASMESFHQESQSHHSTGEQDLEQVPDKTNSEKPQTSQVDQTTEETAVSQEENHRVNSQTTSPAALIQEAEPCTVPFEASPLPGETNLTFERNDDNDVIANCGNPDAYDFVVALIESGASLKVQAEKDGSHPIHLAVQSGSLKMVELILKHAAASINGVRDDKRTPVMVACLEKDYGCVKLLVQSGAIVNAKDSNGLSCMHFRETLESPEILELLIESGQGEIDIASDTLASSGIRHIHSIQENLEHHLSCQGDNLTPLTYACLIGWRALQSVEYLIAKEANLNGLPCARMKPLSAAAGGGSEELIEILLRNGAEVNGKDKGGSTPLLEACKQGQHNAVLKLIEEGADVNAIDENGVSPVMVAVANNSRQLLGVLVAFQADVNKPRFVPEERGGYQITPLALASARGNLDFVETLVEARANVNYDSDLTLPAIAFAGLVGHVHIVEYFLKLNEVQKTLDGLKVAIEIAANNRSHDVLKILLDVLGGYEKVIHHATERNLWRFIDIVNTAYEGIQIKPDESGASVSGRGAASAPLTIGQMERSFESTLEDFVKTSISFIEKQVGQQRIIEEAQRKGNHELVRFFEYFFVEPRIFRDLMREFTRGNPSPSDVIFSGRYFNADDFKQYLEEHGKIDLVERIMVALMQLRTVQALGYDGTQVLKKLFGEEIYHSFESAGLLDPVVIRPPKPPDIPADAPSQGGADASPGPQPKSDQSLRQQLQETDQPTLQRSPTKDKQQETLRESQGRQPSQVQFPLEPDGYQEQRASVNGVPMDRPVKPVVSRFSKPGRRQTSQPSQKAVKVKQKTSEPTQPGSQLQPEPSFSPPPRGADASPGPQLKCDPSPRQQQQETDQPSPTLQRSPKTGRWQETPREFQRRQPSQVQFSPGRQMSQPGQKAVKMRPKISEQPSFQVQGAGQHPKTHRKLSSVPPQHQSTTRISVNDETTHPKYPQGNGVVPQKTTEAHNVNIGAHSVASAQKAASSSTSTNHALTRKPLHRQSSVPPPHTHKTDNAEALPHRTLSQNSYSSLDSEDSLTHLPPYTRQGTGYASNPDVPKERQNDHRPLAKLQQPLEMERREVKEFMKDLARHIPHWQKLAFQLGFDEEEVDTLETNSVMEEEQCCQMLKQWPQKGNALYSTLAQELRNLQWGDLETMVVEHVERLIVPAQLPEHPEQEDIPDMVVNEKNIDKLPCMIRPLFKEHGYEYFIVKLIGTKK